MLQVSTVAAVGVTAVAIAHDDGGGKGGGGRRIVH